MNTEDVVFKGRKDGVLVILNDRQDFEILKMKLHDKLEASDCFFKGAEVTVDVGQRVLTSQQLLELERIIHGTFGVKMIRVVHGDDDNLVPVEAVAAAETFEISPMRSENKGKNPPVRTILKTESPSGFQGSAAYFSHREMSEEKTLLVKRTLRSGQRVYYDGNVVVLGDVNPGAEVVASGDIIVMGSLRGVAHAGATGYERAIVAAFRLQPTQLRIAGYISRPPDEDTSPPTEPEMARVKHGMVVIDPYLPHGL